MIDVLTAYYEFNSLLNTIDEYIEKTFLKNNGIQNIIDGYQGENKDLLEYYKSIIGSQIQYNAIIINLYGAYENFVKSIAKYYLLELLKRCDHIVNVPEKIRYNYEKNLGEFLFNPNRFNNTNLRQKDSIKNYLQFLESDFVCVDTELILSHSGNLKTDQLRELLNNIGLLNNIKLSASVFLERYYIKNDICDKAEFESKKARHENDLFLPLDQLVTSRNNVAHTGEDRERISSALLRESTIPFLHTVSRIILDYIINMLSSFNQESSDFSIIDVFRNHILCISNQGKNIRIGDVVVYKHNDEFKNAIITEIEIDHKKVTETGEVRVDVGLNLDNTICENDVILSIINK